MYAKSSISSYLAPKSVRTWSQRRCLTLGRVAAGFIAGFGPEGLRWWDCEILWAIMWNMSWTAVPGLGCLSCRSLGFAGSGFGGFAGSAGSSGSQVSHCSHSEDSQGSSGCGGSGSASAGSSGSAWWGSRGSSGSSHSQVSAGSSSSDGSGSSGSGFGCFSVCLGAFFGWAGRCCAGCAAGRAAGRAGRALGGGPAGSTGPLVGAWTRAPSWRFQTSFVVQGEFSVQTLWSDKRHEEDNALSNEANPNNDSRTVSYNFLRCRLWSCLHMSKATTNTIFHHIWFISTLYSLSESGNRAHLK